MSKKSCVYRPSIGTDLFDNLRRQFDYTTTREIFLTAINPDFKNDYKDSLRLDSEGVPYIESILTNPHIQNLLGKDKILSGLQSQYKAVEDTIENYNMLLEEAFTFNTSSVYNNDYIAIIDKKEDKLKVTIKEKTPVNINTFNNQYSTFKLNNKIVEIFKPLNITIGQLTKAETLNGRVGVTDFSKAKDVAKGFSSIIRVANNMEGAKAISEEFSHLMVEVFKENALVQRSLNALINNKELVQAILGDQYSDIYEFYDGNKELIAEEALGKILQDNLIFESNIGEYKNKSLFKRVIDTITSKFKNYNVKDIENAIIEVDSSLNTLAKNILQGTITPTKTNILNINRDDEFNALSSNIERNIQILKEAQKTAIKKSNIYKTTESRTVIEDLESYLSDEEKTTEGLLYYAKNGYDELKSFYTRFKEFDNLNPYEQFSLLRASRDYVNSYGKFINDIKNALIEDSEDTDSELKKVIEIGEDGLGISVKSIIGELSRLSDIVTKVFLDKSKKSFLEFLKPAMPENFLNNYNNIVGNNKTLESLLEKADSDISFFDRFLDSMADSSDILLQIIDSRVKMTKDNIRISTIQDIKKIQKWMLDAENAGVTNFDWMFERDSEGNLGRHYISAINYAEYDLAYKKFEESLNEKYGENPQGTELYNKTVEKREWIKVNTEIVGNTRVPKESLYKNNTYYNLSDTHKKILNDFLNIKSIFDRRYESADTSTNKVIQIRKNAIQRIADSSNSASSLYQNAKNALNESLKDTADDDVIFGETKTGLKNFDGSEYLMLPMLYVKDLENPNEVSTDVVRSLMCYAYSTNNYSGLSNIINPLEIGRVIINEVREVQETRGGQKLVERLKSNGINISNPITKKNGSNIADRYKDYLESQVYQRYLKDEGVIGNTKLNISKTTSAFLQYSSAVQLGFNWLANIANVTTGIAMQNIEAAASEFYSAKELFLADKEYAKNIASLVAELPSRIKTNKLSLFGEMFNIKQDYEKDIKRVQKKNLLGRIFGSSIQFLGQEGGDHWLYYRTAIAMCIRIKVLVPGKGEMSLWDALTIENVYKGREDIKIMKLPKGTTYSDGKPVDINKIGRQIANINQHLFGIYNEDDANAANRLALGRLLMQYRKWMKPQFNKRFMSKQYNITLDKDQEGYYRTLLRVALELKRGKYQLGALKEQLKEEEKSNINRALFEILQFYIVLSLTKFVNWGDDEDRPWALKLLEYISQRSVHELGALTVASPKHFVQENLKTIKTPMPSIGIIDNSLKAIGSLVDHHDRTHVLQSGPYKGMTILEKNFYKAPIPGLSQYRSLDKFFDDIESSTEYYMRTY